MLPMRQRVRKPPALKGAIHEPEEASSLPRTRRRFRSSNAVPPLAHHNRT